MKKPRLKKLTAVPIAAAAVAVLFAVFVLPRIFAGTDKLAAYGEYAEEVVRLRGGGAGEDEIFEAELRQFEDVKVGDRVFYGCFYRDNGVAYSPVEWRVLDVSDDGFLVVAEHAVICSPVNAEYGAFTWKDCALRKDLNEYYFGAMFTDAEKGRVLTTRLDGSDNPVYGTDGGEPTEDRLFILSAEEVMRYFPDRADRTASPTGYAVLQGAQVYDDGNVMWWLRTPGFIVSRMAAVCDLGCIHYGGLNVDHTVVGVRPAMRIGTDGK